jgi:hypothetical protein
MRQEPAPLVVVVVPALLAVLTVVLGAPAVPAIPAVLGAAEGFITMDTVLTLPVPLLRIILGVAEPRIVTHRIRFKIVATISLTTLLVDLQLPEVRIM